MPTHLEEYLDSQIIDLRSAKEAHEKKSIFEHIRQNVPATFYIDVPGTEHARELFDIASKFATELSHGMSASNDEIWKLLMPKLINTETACRFPLPGYEERQQLILTYNGTHLLSIPEMIQTCDADPSLHSLPNLHGDCSLTISEQAQIRLKNLELWNQYYNRGELWQTQNTLEKFIFILNIAISSKDEIDATLESKFAEALSKVPDFNDFYKENFKETVITLKFHDANELRLTCCYKYFEAYLKTLPQEEQFAFKLIQLNNRNLYETLISINTGNTCMTMAAYGLSDFAFALTSIKNSRLWEHDLVNRRHIWNHDIIGTL